MTRRWDIMNVTDVHPSPVSVRTSQSSAFLSRRSRLTENKIDQSLAVLDDIVTNTTASTDMGMTTPTSGYSVRDGQYDRSTMEYNPLEETTMVSFMDDSSSLKESHQYPAASTSVMDTTALQSTIHAESAPSHKNPTIWGTSHDNDDPIKKAGNALMHSFHNSLSEYSSSGQILDLLSTFSEVCTNQIHHLKSVSKSNKLADSISELSLERDTWLIAEAIYSDRLGGALDDEEEGLVDMESDGNVLTDKMIVDKYFEQDREVREAQMVVDWLERISANSLEDFPLKVKYFADSVCWENTVHDIQQGLNKGHIVTEVDPDAPVRQNKNLSELDESDEQSLCKHLFKYIRAGQLKKAQELCVQCGQSWRAATMDGWKLHHDPNLDRGFGDDLEPIEGNCGRDLWKNCCWEMSNCSSYSVHERAMYAALCGNKSQLLLTCQTWYDMTWSYYRVMVDVLVEQKLRSSDRFPPDRISEELPKDYWNAQLIPDLIFQEIEASPSSTVHAQSANMYHQVQKFMILGDLESLIDTLHSWLDKYLNSLHHHRFMAHIVLFVKTVGLNYDVSKCDEIMKTFVEHLSFQSHESLVALYASYLPSQLQVQCYSELLSGIHGNRNQKNCLKLAHEAGLDVAKITKTVVENMRIKAREEIPKNAFDVTLGQEFEILKTDVEKINVLDWLFYDETQRPEAIHQANAMIRIFLAVRKHSAALLAFKKIPNDSPAIIEKHWKRKAGDIPLSKNIENDLLEYCSIKAYLEAIESFNVWFQSFHSKKMTTPPVPPLGDDFTEKVGYERQLKNYEDGNKQLKIQQDQLAQAAEHKIYNVLLFVKGGWMVDIKDCDQDDSRKKQLSLLRQLCIPYLCLLLHTVFHNSKNYKKCLQLADAVASERHKLYSLFHKDELQKFLSLIQSSALELLDTPDVDAFGYNSVV